jgi:uncharacterized protein with FMN-binding domain
MQNTYQQQAKTKLIATCVAIVVVAGVIVLVDHLKATKMTNAASTSPSATSQTATDTTSTTSTDTPTISSGRYKDGTYTAENQYYVPHGYEDIKVTVTLKNGFVTDSSIVNSESDHDSARYQEDFVAAYKSYVVGKKVGDIHLSYVAGASDTTQAFNDALSQIESKAQA